MNRIDQYFKDMQHKIDLHTKFYNEKHELFIKDLNSVIIPSLRKYRTGVVNPCDNNYIDVSPFDDKDLTYVVVLPVNINHLSSKQCENLCQIIKTGGAPINAVHFDKIVLRYRNYES